MHPININDMKTNAFVVVILVFMLHFQAKATLDIGITALVSPSAIVVNPGSTYPVTITIKNFGTSAVQNFDIRYSIDNGPLITVTYSGLAISFMSSINFTLTNYTFPCQLFHHFSIFTSLPGDIDHTNDTLNMVFSSAVPQQSYTLQPSLLPFSSGTVGPLGFVNNSLVQCQAGQQLYGWISFDLSGVPQTATLDSATLFLKAASPYVNPEISLVKLNNPPYSSTAAVVWQEFQNAIPLQTLVLPGSAGSMLAIPLNAQVLSAISNSIPNGVFTLGFKEVSPGLSNVATFQGALQTTNPYIIVNSTQPFAHDVGVTSVSTMPPGPIPTSPMAVEATIANYGTSTETCSVTCSGTGGFTSTVSNISMIPGSFAVITFPDVYNPPAGSVCLQVETQLATDQNCLNNTDTLCFASSTPVLINGMVNYANSASTLLNDSTYAYLVPLNPPGPVITDTVDSNGLYEFVNPAPGTYVLMASSDRHWKGVNATDALKAMQHYVGMIQLSGMNARAADVNADGWINALDALLIARRFVGQINSFAAGDWIFEDFNIQINSGQSLFQNIRGIIVGDTDGSY